MLASAIGFTLMTTLVKFLGGEYSAALQSFYRQAAGVILVLPLVARDPIGVFRTNRLGILLFRSAAGTAASILAFYSYSEMPLADANALSFTRTLWLAPLAAFVLHEKVGPARIGATLVGFAGVLFMLQPAQMAAFGWGAAAALASAFLFALTITGMKIMTRDHSTTTLIAYAAILGLVFSTPPALASWKWPGLVDLSLLAAMGILGLLAQTCYIKGMAIGDAGAMTPIDYTRLIFAVIAGFFLFDELPNAMTLIGAGIVIAATLYITLREARMRKGLTPPPAQPE